MKGKILVVVIVVLVMLVGAWLNAPTNTSNSVSEWPTSECSQFFGNTQAAELLCLLVEVLGGAR